MSSYNRVIMMGNLTRDPEFKQLGSGTAVCRLGLASNRQFKNRQTGALVQEVCFVDVDVWGPQAESCSKYLQKGRPVLVEGRLKLDSWQDNDGQKRSKHTIQADRVTFLGAGVQGEEGDESFAATATTETAPTESPARRPRAAAASPRAAAPRPAAQSLSNGGTTPKGELHLSDAQPFEDDLPF